MPEDPSQLSEYIDALRARIDTEILDLPRTKNIPLFYDPIEYVNTLGGKKLRPLFAVICGLAVGGKIEQLLPAAAAIELLHNFSLVHDDIMDQDETRRGMPTVHIKWDVGTAILAGDGLLGLAYQKLLSTPNISDTRLISLFTEAMLEICRGQALDKAFETADFVTEQDYLEMIKKKTAVLISLACRIGVIVGGGSDEQIAALSDYGMGIGLGFQVQDDLLDILADEEKLGKKVGSDLEMNKKTIATIKLAAIVGNQATQNSRLDEVRGLLDTHGINTEIEKMVSAYFSVARQKLKSLPQTRYKDLLIFLTDYIQNREM